MSASTWRADGSRCHASPDEAHEGQLDLFAGGGLLRPFPAAAAQPAILPAGLDDAALIAAIPGADVIDGPALAMAAGRRGLAAAVPALEELCRRFAGFGIERALPEQVAALEALATIGGREAARSVARLIARAAVQGPALKIAMAAAAGLGSDLPAAIVLTLLRNPDPGVRADACRCVRAWPEAVPVLLELHADPEGEVSAAAACALGQLGRREALPILLALLARAPSREVIDAVTKIADEDCVVLLARIVRTLPHLADAALEALDVIEHPRAAQLLESLTGRRSG